MICKTAMKIFGLLNRGVIINISSVVGESGNAFQSVYAATKAGLTALSRSLAQEAAALNESHNIRVLSVSPGFIETDMTAGIPEKIKEKIPKYDTCKTLLEMLMMWQRPLHFCFRTRHLI